MFKKIMAVTLSFLMIFCLSACGKNDEKASERAAFEEKGDYLTGYDWESSDGLLIELNTDGTFKFYQNSGNKNDNYYSGKFEVKSAQSAIEYITSEWGPTEDDQRQVMDRFSVEDKDYYVLILNNEQCIMNGQNNLEKANKIEYFGYYVADNTHINFTRLNDLVETTFYRK